MMMRSPRSNGSSMRPRSRRTSPVWTKSSATGTLMKSNERILWGIAVAWLIALLVIAKGPRWGNVIDVTEYPLGYSVCVKGHLQTDCYSVEKEVYDACYV